MENNYEASTVSPVTNLTTVPSAMYMRDSSESLIECWHHIVVNSAQTIRHTLRDGCLRQTETACLSAFMKGNRAGKRVILLIILFPKWIEVLTFKNLPLGWYFQKVHSCPRRNRSVIARGACLWWRFAVILQVPVRSLLGEYLLLFKWDTYLHHPFFFL